ncbi:hypothetical protein CHISP_0030 [Chitinispirillum alkaliphilum]|nr:hypothetical protein CHISP_0030 [Chitinispirillum alkaliphilum]
MNKTCTLLYALLLCVYLASCRRPPEPISLSPAPDTITIAFYNVENLFDFYKDGTEYPEYVPNAFNWTRDIQITKTQNTADVLQALNADILALCEIENRRVLRQLRDTLRNRGDHFPYMATGESTTAVTTALLSKFKITGTQSHPVPFSSGRRVRAILEADILVGDDTLKLFINHWPSKFNPESNRLKAASILKERLLSLDKNTDYIILGDLNSNYNEYVTFHTEGFNDTEGKTGINHLLGTAQTTPGCFTISYTQKYDLKSNTENLLHYNLWLELPEKDRWSYIFRGAGQTLDHILLPSSLFNSSGFSYLDNSFKAFCWDGKLLRDGVPYRWQMHFRGRERYHSGRGYSDHLPIKARFVRHPYTFDTDLIMEETACSLRFVLGEFETGKDGWVSANSQFTVRRDTLKPASGNYSLRISGKHPTRNVSAAKCRLLPDPHATSLALDLRGSGKISFRIRYEDGEWVYFNAPYFTQTSVPRYFEPRTNSWERFTLPLPSGGNSESDIKVEIRAGRGEFFDFFIDRVKLK